MAVNIITLKNKYPTKTEKELYMQYGYYPVEWINTDAGLIVRYAVCCKEKGQRKHYPEQIKIAERDINYKDGFLFDAMMETIKIFCYSDLNLLNLIIARGKELGFSEL